jgi:hypothetical protein
MRQLIMFAATLAAVGLASSAASAAGSGKFCLKGSGGQLTCSYQTMASCDKAKKGTETCVANPSSTTGAGKSSGGTMKKY